MSFSFDRLIDRRNSDSVKWNFYPPDVLPMWVADMDFRSPEPVIQALHERIDHGFYGYVFDSSELRAVLVERLAARYQYEIQAEHLVFLPNLVSALSIMAGVVGTRGDDVLMTPPIYPPFFNAVLGQERTVKGVPLIETHDNGILRYEIDFDALEAAITPQTKLLLFCNPHNPVGRAYTRAELERVADICVQHDLIICSDEIHCDLVYQAGAHIPIASLSPELAARTVTLMAPSKTFNLPGLGFGFAVIGDDDLRQRFMTAGMMTGVHPYITGLTAATVAYRDCQPWLDELLPYLQENRDTLVDYVKTHLPDVETTCPEATYLAWLDCRALNLEPTPAQFFVEKGRVGFSDGAMFGADGAGFVRVNFGCPRSMLMDALERMRGALEQR